jgi:branched-chain amino acid transport system substrate-binding protein
MRERLSRRRFIRLCLGAAAGAAFVAHAQTERHLRVGIITPTRSGEGPVRASIHDFTGDGARMGAALADSRIGQSAAAAGFRYEPRYANAPSVEAARRAAERLVRTGEVSALVGGIGEGQAEVIAAVADRYGIPFLNVGDADDSLRARYCGRGIFHLEPSAAMYLDAMVAHQAALAPRNWFIVHERSAVGEARLARAREAIARFDPRGAEAGALAVAREQPLYLTELERIASSAADAILLLIEARDQIAFQMQQDDRMLPLPVIAFPEVLGQTRDFLAASRHLAPESSPRVRYAAWDTALAAPDADALNAAFIARWGTQMDPTAWTTYQAIAMVALAAEHAGSVDPVAIAAALIAPDFSLPGGKIIPGSFRSWDQQLRQPIVAIRIDPRAPWDRLAVRSRVALGEVEDLIPRAAALATLTAAEAIEALDAFGDGPTCLAG